MQKALFSAIGILVISVVAGALTEFTLAYGGRLSVVDGPVHPTKSPPLRAAPRITSTSSATATPSVPPAAKTAVTNGFVHLRASPTTNAAIIGNLDGGTTVILGSYVDPQWQGVVVNGQSGYIYRTYLNY